MIGIIGGSGVYEITQKADKCVEKLFAREGESVEETKIRLRKKEEM